MSTHRRLWGWGVAAATAVALLGTALGVPLASVLGLACVLAAFGASMGYLYGPELPGVRHPVLASTALFAAPALYPGLAHVVGGGGALGVVAVLVLSSPWGSARLLPHLRGRFVPTREQAALAATPEDALRWQWEESTRQLALASTVRERLLLVALRQEILDDVVARSGGLLPDYLWTGERRPEGG